LEVPDVDGKHPMNSFPPVYRGFRIS
jgi:hypothetical protein